MTTILEIVSLILFVYFCLFKQEPITNEELMALMFINFTIIHSYVSKNDK